MLKKQPDRIAYAVYKMQHVHNHEMFTEDELQMLPHNRFIPKDVQEKILELNKYGRLDCRQLIFLIEKVHFPEAKVTWTARDIQNLCQSQIDRLNEADEFVQLLEGKRDQGWCVSAHYGRGLALERIFWISETGLRRYRCFNDVLELDAT